jgi:hypothetical protein
VSDVKEITIEQKATAVSTPFSAYLLLQNTMSVEPRGDSNERNK